MKRTIVFLTSTLLLLGACGLAVTRGPPAGHEKMMTAFSCTESWTGPALDILAGLTTIFLVALANGLDDSGDHTVHAENRRVVGGAMVGVFAVSAGIGIDRIGKCSAARRALTLRQAEAAAALAARRHSAADLIAVRNVLITGGRDTMTAGEWTQLVATAYDSTGAVIVDKMFTWSSSNDTIATVRADGLLRLRRVGTAVITANAGNVIGTTNIVVVLPH
jgi:hypothetical protein